MAMAWQEISKKKLRDAVATPGPVGEDLGNKIGIKSEEDKQGYGPTTNKDGKDRFADPYVQRAFEDWYAKNEKGPVFFMLSQEWRDAVAASKAAKSSSLLSFIEPKGGVATAKTESRKKRKELFSSINRQRLILTSGQGVEEEATLGKKRAFGA